MLEDMKLYASSAPKLSLTKEQSDLLNNLVSHLKSKNKVGTLVDSLTEKDFNRKGYLSRAVIEDILKRLGYNFSTKQFNALFATMETNH